MNNKSKLVDDLTSFFSDVNSSNTPSTKATELADILEEWVKTFEIQSGTLSSTGTGNLGSPVVSSNTNGGSLS